MHCRLSNFAMASSVEQHEMIRNDGTSLELEKQFARHRTVEALQHVVQQVVQLRASFQAAVNESVALKERLDLLQSKMFSDRPPPRTDLELVYRAAGVELPGVALRRFVDVEVFYESLSSNRLAHLADEAAETKDRLEMLERKAIELDQMRSTLLRDFIAQASHDDLLALRKILEETQDTAEISPECPPAKFITSPSESPTQS